MSDYDGNFIDDWSPLSSPSIREVIAMLDQNNNGLNPISETFPLTNSSIVPQSEQRSGGLRDRMAARLGYNIPSIEIESDRPFANYFRNPVIVPSPILVISPGFSLSPLLQSPNMLSNSSQITPSWRIPNDWPMETVGISVGTHATIIISSNNLPHQPMDVDLHPQRGNHHNIAVEPSSRKRRRNVVSNMIGVTRQNKTKRVIIQVESEEDYPDDGFHWRKYGQRIVIGNANPRSYYRCTYTGCQVRKRVERSTDNVKFVVVTYDGKHEHLPPPEWIKIYRTWNLSGSSMSQDPSNQTLGLSTLPSSVTASQLFPSPLAPQLDMMHHYMDGLSKPPSLPVVQNHGFMNVDDEMNTDRVISDGTELYRAIRERLFLYFGFNPYGKP